MQTQINRSGHGFSLVEMLIAMSVGLIVLGGAVEMYTRSVSATWSLTQKSQMQQDARAAFNLLTQDIGLAGAGLPYGGVAITSSTGTTPLIGCDFVSATPCHLGANNNISELYPP